MNRYDNWLDYIEDLNKFKIVIYKIELSAFQISDYLKILKNIKSNGFFIMGKADKLECI